MGVGRRARLEAAKQAGIPTVGEREEKQQAQRRRGEGGVVQAVPEIAIKKSEHDEKRHHCRDRPVP